MKLTTADTGAFLADVEAAYRGSVDDTLADARGRAPKKTGRYARSLEARVERSGDRLTAGLTSPLSSARLKETGGVVAAKRGPYLTVGPFADGSYRKVRSVRIPPRPTVTPAGEAWPERFLARLRGVHPRGGSR